MTDKNAPKAAIMVRLRYSPVRDMYIPDSTDPEEDATTFGKKNRPAVDAL
jgi:hypothetical protein